MRDINWKTIIIELLIVFVGVYGAFMLNSYRQGIQEDQARLKYYNTFLKSLEGSDDSIENLKNKVDETIQKVRNEESDELLYNRELDFTSVFFIFESAYSGNNFKSIDTQYLINIQNGTSLIKYIEKRFNVLDEEVRKFKLYGKNSERAAFRNWYLNELDYLSGLLATLKKTIVKGAIPGTKKMIEDLE